MSATFSVRRASWPRDQTAIASIRDDVFVRELGVPASLERDGRDAASEHAVAEDAHGRAIGCARLLADGSLGRVAVRRDWRSRGVGGALLERLVEIAASRGQTRVSLNAQADACEFYARHGFVRVGEPWIEAGLEHVAMQREL